MRFSSRARLGVQSSTESEAALTVLRYKTVPTAHVDQYWRKGRPESGITLVRGN